MRVMHFGPVWRANRRERVQRRRASWLACLAILAAALLGCVLPQVASAESGAAATLGAELGASSLEPSPSTGPEEISLTPSTTKPYYACPSEGCQAIDEPPAIKTTTGYDLPDGTQLVGGGPEGGYTPEELELAYNIPKTGGKEPEQQTVAVIDAHGDTTAESDLAVYREHYKLGECKKENTKKEVTNCFRKVNQEGKEEKYPANESGWGTETSLDLDMVSAACPECHILLVEANNEEESEMAASVNKAVELGATEISSSYGFPETYATRCPETGCSKYQSDYNHSGIPITVSAGDFGYDNRYYPVELSKPAPMFPASSPTVIAVGGTALHIENNARSSETVWSESGSGCSEFESTKSTGQKETEEKEGRKGCTSDRTDNDVAADASCATPVSFYSTPSFGGWSYECGTSVASPFVAGIEAHASKSTRALGANAFYKKPSMLFHVSEGSNGECGTESESKWYLCHATKEGYNGPTGMGTPDGVFTSGPVAVTEAATSITKTGATLNGAVNPEGVETKYYFEYGTSTSYGSKTAEASAGSGTSSVKESKAITGLTAGKQYDFRIVATNSSSETSDGSNQVFTTLPNAPENTVLPVISPTTPVRGEPEATTNGTWTNSPTSYAYQWELCNATGGECANISGATSSTFTPVEADVEHTLVVKVTAKNSGGEGSALAKATNKVKLPSAPENTALPVTSPETPDQAVPESTTTGTWTNSPTSYAYQWERCNATGGECAAISGATSSKYTPVEADVGHTLVVKVTAKNSGGEGSAHSKATNKVKPIGEITEYALPTGSIAFDIASGPNGDLWFTEQGTNKIGEITTSGTITEYSLPSSSTPWGIAAGSDGNMWFTEWGTGKIGKITTSGTVTEYSLPSKTSAPKGIAAGPEGDLWFAAPGSNTIGKITTSGTITEYSVTAAEQIVAGPDGNMWFTNPVKSTIGKITTSGTITEYSLPSKSEPVAITSGPEEDLWFEDEGTFKIGKITTAGTAVEYSVPNGGEPYETGFEGLAAGPDGNVWFAYGGTNKLGKITTSGTVTEYSPLSGSVIDIVEGPDDNMWFAAAGKVGKITP